ncbi:hypothetical protein NP493_229g02047 [Ridgeia piscesae]|uniref:Uncharacterized protein n=1 Tax=Ridgeia piscesae TaxID=27915 RepID=A0AAD9P0A9_RIDPI|nr:hypothetical protein NP493_229g02047 [Ridgeia piscesae]
MREGCSTHIHHCLEPGTCLYS